MAKVLIVLAATLVGVFGRSTVDLNRNWRIIGGSDAPEGAYPYQVSLRNTNGAHKCGGSIIKPTVILTAARCIAGKEPNYFMVVVGSNKISSGGTPYEVKIVKYHEDFGEISGKNDIGLLILSSPIEYTDKIGPIALSTEEVGSDVSVTFTGWGIKSYPIGEISNNLQHVQLQTISNDECKESYANSLRRIYDSQVCSSTARGEGACYGDSGNPLATNGTLVGIASWGTPCAVGDPDVSTRVSHYIDWINENSD